MNTYLTGLCSAALILMAGTAMAADVKVTVHNVNDEGGEIRASVCDKANWLTYNCPYRLRADTKVGGVVIVFKNIPPGEWAVIADHDANMNGKLDENLLGIPTEQFGFSRNPGYMHKPDFSESSFTVGKDDIDLSVDFEK